MQHNEKGSQRDLVLYRIETAKSDVKSAKILLEAGEYRGANNRAYYGIFILSQQYMHLMAMLTRDIRTLLQILIRII